MPNITPGIPQFIPFTVALLLVTMSIYVFFFFSLDGTVDHSRGNSPSHLPSNVLLLININNYVGEWSHWESRTSGQRITSANDPGLPLAQTQITWKPTISNLHKTLGTIKTIFTVGDFMANSIVFNNIIKWNLWQHTPWNKSDLNWHGVIIKNVQRHP